MIVACPICWGSGRFLVSREVSETLTRAHKIIQVNFIARIDKFLKVYPYRHDVDAWDLGDCVFCDGVGEVSIEFAAAYRFMRADGIDRYNSCNAVRAQLTDLCNNPHRKIAHTKTYGDLFNLLRD